METTLSPVPSKEDFIKRLNEYNKLSDEFVTDILPLIQWAKTEHFQILKKIFTSIAQFDKGSNGYKLWISLGWYPFIKLLYFAGIVSISSERYDILSFILKLKIDAFFHGEEKNTPLIPHSVISVSDTHEGFKWLPGLEQKYVPRSEYLFDNLKSSIENILLISKDYEKYFDKFEVLLALVCADLDNGWGPIGRFGWKHSRRIYGDPFEELITEANKEDDNWILVKSGLFDGKRSKFLKIAEDFKKVLGTRAMTWS